jgi:hypothetical protein
MPVIQTLNGRYIDGAALLSLLTRLFGYGNFRIDVRYFDAKSAFMSMHYE